MKLISIIYALMFSIQALGNVQLSVTGINNDVLDRSPTGIQVGIKFDDGSIVNPSFSIEELRAGIVEKIIFEEDRSILSCAYNWLFVSKATDFAPRGFQGVNDGSCQVSEGRLIIKSPAAVRNVVITIEKTAFETVDATRLILTISAQDSAGSQYQQKIVQSNILQTPLMLERTFVQIMDNELHFLLKPLWVRTAGNVQGDPISFQNDEFVLK